MSDRCTPGVVSEDSCGERCDGTAKYRCPAQTGRQLPGLMAFTELLDDNSGRLTHPTSNRVHSRRIGPWRGFKPSPAWSLTPESRSSRGSGVRIEQAVLLGLALVIGGAVAAVTLVPS